MNLVLKQIILSFAACCAVVTFWGQISSTGCLGRTSYTDGTPEDDIYYFDPGAGTLTATPPGGTPGWTFVWSVFTVGNSSYTAYTTQTNVPSSTITGLAPGCYAVAIYDGTNTVVGCYRAWVLEVIEEPTVDVDPIAPGCSGPVNLVGTINGGIVSPYSNLPSTAMLIDANTQISICYTGTHTWVSDLAFYAIGPPSCGSPTLLLLPNPGAIGQGTVCNSGNNITNLCFSTESSNNINVCAPAPAALSGTYGTYGPNSTAINWGTFYGCDASNGGWSVQIYDCIGGDTGALTDATLTFTGVDACGDAQTVTYTTPPGYSSGIADQSCSSGSASIFTVTPATAPDIIECEFGYLWTSEPFVYIADSTTSLNITLNEFLDANGNVIPFQDVNFTLSITNSCDSIAGVNGCFGGNSSDTELFDFTPLQVLSIDPIPTLCLSSSPVNLVANVPGGTWGGTGIIDAIAGTFDPVAAGEGVFEITYDINDPCSIPATLSIEVVAVPVVEFTPPVGFCVDASVVQLEDYLVADDAQFSGDGIVNANDGSFDPAVAGVGIHTIQVDVFGICPVTATANIIVYALPVVNAGADADVCAFSSYALLAAGASEYVWSPSTYLSNNQVANPNAAIDIDMTYTVTGTDINGCQDSDNITLTLLPLPEVSVTNVAMICPGETVALEASGSDGDFTWTPAAGVTGANSASATASPNITTTYTVTLTDNCNIDVSATLTVPVETVYTVNAGSNQVFCSGDSLTLVADVTGADPTLNWVSVNGIITGSGDSESLVVNTPGNYVLEVITPLGCTYSDAVLVGETPLPNLNLIDSTHYCPYGSVILNAGYNWDNVLWSTGENTPDITVSSPGDYGVVVTDNGCTSEGSIHVSQIILPYVELGPDIEICQGDVAALSAGVFGEWSTGDNDDIIFVSYAGTYELEVSIEECSTMDSVHVIVNPLPFLYLGQPLVGCENQPVSIYADHPYNTSYLWSNGATTSSITVFTPDVYWVTASNECGEVVDYIDVSFEDCTYAVYIPNSFTPDQDGINDVWQISTFNVTNVETIIYNKWGEVMYISNDEKPTWTGEVRGGDYFAPDGIYHYRIKFDTETTETVERVGSVIIIR